MDIQKIAEKILSGRFILTVLSGLVFAYTACKGMLPGEAVAAILVSVFAAYFQRPDRKPAP